MIGRVIDLDLRFQIPQKYARIIGEKGEKASSRGATMEVENMLKNTQEHTQTVGEEEPFVANRNRAVGGKSREKTGQKSVSPGSTPDRPVHSPASAGPASETYSRRVLVQPRYEHRTGRCTARHRRPETGLPVKIPVLTGFVPTEKLRR
jgi:hypothetical protein